MKISAGRVDGFIAKPDPAITAILIYGPDSGLVRERSLTLANSVVDDLSDPFLAAELTGGMIGETPARLADEMLALSLGGGERLVVVRDATESITTPLKLALEATAEADANVTVVAGGGRGGGDGIFFKPFF